MKKSEALYFHDTLHDIKENLENSDEEIAIILIKTLECYVSKVLVEIRDEEFRNNG